MIKQKNKVKKLRIQSIVPGVIYGDNENISISINENLLKRIYNGPFGKNTIIELTIKGEKEVKKDVISYQIDRHPVTGDFRHIDFLVIDETKKVKATIPTKVIGVAPGVKLGGMLQQSAKAISIKSFPNSIPENIKIDVSSMQIGATIKAKDIILDDTFELLTNPNNLILQVSVSRVKKDEQTDNADVTETESEPSEKAAS
mgnify:FL=1